MITVSVAGCLGYDVLDGLAKVNRRSTSVSVKQTAGIISGRNDNQHIIT
jgi:hypothetical protein